MKKVFSVSDDGDHIACFETEAEADEIVSELHLRGHRYADYSECEYEPNCDCGNQNIRDDFDKEII